MKHLKIEGKGMPVAQPTIGRTHGDFVVLFTNNSEPAFDLQFPDMLD